MEVTKEDIDAIEEKIMLKNNNNPSCSFIANIKAITSSVVSG